MKVIRAIDVGYGQTKFIKESSNGHFICELFPSIAPTISGPLLQDPLLKNSDILKIEIGGVSRVVGKEALHFQSALSTRILDESYSGSETYMALTHGALFYMGKKMIDLLVVGLPVSVYANTDIRESLQKKLTGLHKINKEFFVQVENVQVLPQPLGGLYDAATQNPDLSNIKNQKTLIIDAGFHTFDYIIANGIKYDHQQKGSYHKCMGAILTSIAEGISADPKVNGIYSDIQRIDDAIVNNDPFQVNGHPYDLRKHLLVAETIAEEAVTAMVQKVGNGTNIDNILICGGGARFFLNKISQRFPNHNVQIAKDNIFSNVRGFQIAGEMLAPTLPATRIYA